MQSGSAAYKQAGVDIAAGDLFAQMIAKEVTDAWPHVKIGGFADGGRIPAGATTFKGGADGVGTKIDLARRVDMLRVVGCDAVAMTVVDLYMDGTMPVALYDYLVVEHLEPEKHIEIIRGMISGCVEAGCYLVGGETAEHPGVGLPKGYFDIGAFCVGFPDPQLQLDPKRNIRPGMWLWGWESGGVGSNGYSLARRVLKLRDDKPSRIQARLERCYPEVGRLADALLTPTAIHVKNIEAVRQRGVNFVGHTHITGGGLLGNIPRILPDDCVARITVGSWAVPPIFDLIWAQAKSFTSLEEMRGTFNLGLQVVSVTKEGGAVSHPQCTRIGYIRKREHNEPQVEFRGRYVW